MKKRIVSLLFMILLKAGVAQADTVIGEVPDTLPGKGFGGVSGFMAGAAAGGPIGAAIGAGVGWLVGGETHRATGLSGAAYRVLHDDGTVTIVRSPGRTWFHTSSRPPARASMTRPSTWVAPGRTTRFARWRRWWPTWWPATGPALS